MPELPEVETVKNGIEKFIGHAEIKNVIIRNRNFRDKICDDFEKTVIGTKIKEYKRIGKYIVINLDNHQSIICHLGMSGRIKTIDSKPTELEKHDHVIMQTSNGWLIFNDPRRFGLLDVCPTEKVMEHKHLNHIGADPLSPELSAQSLYLQLQKRHIPIKQALLDQKMIAGIGNIYASEILYDAQILPTRLANQISLIESKNLVLSIRKILLKAIENGGSTLHDYHKPDGSLGYFQNLHCVYNKTGQRCPNCNCKLEKTGGIRKITQAGRSTFYCAVKQK